MISNQNDFDARTVLNDLCANWTNLALGKEIPGLVNLYTEHAIFFGSLPAMYSGRRGVTEYFETASLSTLTSIRFDWQQVTPLRPAIINAGGFVYFGATLEGEDACWRFGISWVLVKHGAGWQIASHHASRRELPPAERADLWLEK